MNGFLHSVGRSPCTGPSGARDFLRRTNPLVTPSPGGGWFRNGASSSAGLRPPLGTLAPAPARLVLREAIALHGKEYSRAGYDGDQQRERRSAAVVESVDHGLSQKEE